jgi:hypothetical protein
MPQRYGNARQHVTPEAGTPHFGSLSLDPHQAEQSVNFAGGNADIALERRQESVISSSLLTLGILLACLAPLVMAGFALVMLNRTPTSEEET